MSSPLTNIIETLIFVSQEPITQEKIFQTLEGSSMEDIKTALDELVLKYDGDGFGIQIRQIGGGYLFMTKPEHDTWVRRFLQLDRKNKLSAASLETLAIIAYQQPLTQAEIAAVRGVDSSYSVKTLLEKKLIKIVGRKKAPGNPLVYKTSETFLEYFGLNGLDELPSETEIAKMLEEENSAEG